VRDDRRNARRGPRGRLPPSNDALLERRPEPRAAFAEQRPGPAPHPAKGDHREVLDGDRQHILGPGRRTRRPAQKGADELADGGGRMSTPRGPRSSRRPRRTPRTILPRPQRRRRAAAMRHESLRPSGLRAFGGVWANGRTNVWGSSPARSRRISRAARFVHKRKRSSPTRFLARWECRGRAPSASLPVASTRRAWKVLPLRCALPIKLRRRFDEKRCGRNRFTSTAWCCRKIVAACSHGAIATSSSILRRAVGEEKV